MRHCAPICISISLSCNSIIIKFLLPYYIFPPIHTELTTSTSSSATSTREPPSGILGMPRELTKANVILQQHPLYNNYLENNNRNGGSGGGGGTKSKVGNGNSLSDPYDKHSHSLEEVMVYIQNSPKCSQQPIYLTMATVGDDLYWQLIENFVYTLVKFEVSECALVICVSDVKCMKMCDAAYFPCYNYIAADTPLPSVMEQIAQVKLLHVPKALNMGVNVFMLDLDVGFLENPKQMVTAFVNTPIVDIFVQVR